MRERQRSAKVNDDEKVKKKNRDIFFWIFLESPVKDLTKKHPEAEEQRKPRKKERKKTENQSLGVVAL